jgi:hypothetical protein
VGQPGCTVSELMVPTKLPREDDSFHAMQIKRKSDEWYKTTQVEWVVLSDSLVDCNSRGDRYPRRKQHLAQGRPMRGVLNVGANASTLLVRVEDVVLHLHSHMAGVSAV